MPGMSISIEQQLLSEGVYVSTTSGYSMWPMLSDRRDRVILHAKGKERLRRGDLPLYRYPDGRYVLHRIIAVKEGYYVVRGDNTYFKEKIPEEWILGYVTEFYRKGKRIDAKQKGYRLYSALWQGIYFIRMPLHALRMTAGKIKRAIFSKKK